jgi:hypothetical protein
MVARRKPNAKYLGCNEARGAHQEVVPPHSPRCTFGGFWEDPRETT